MDRRLLVLWIVILFFLVNTFSCAYLLKSEDGHTRSINFMSAIIDFYRGPLNHCSAVRQGECPMYPSCSEYSKQAFEKYGVFLGAMIASDRVMRCGRDELKTAPVILVEGKPKFYDPLERNTYWWDKNTDRPGRVVRPIEPL